MSIFKNKTRHQYWKEQTYNDWRFPYNPKQDEAVVSNQGDKALTLRYCTKCDTVYESTWMGGKYKYYKMFIYEDFPKSHKKLTCPKCNGKKVRIANI